jgi:hypothetical protein
MGHFQNDLPPLLRSHQAVSTEKPVDFDSKLEQHSNRITEPGEDPVPQ